jgi:Ca-activated chloride channel family protein
MYKIENIAFIWMLLAVPISALVIWLWFRWRNSVLNVFGDPVHVGKLIPGLSNSRPWIKWVFLALLFLFATGALMNPKVGSKMEEVQRNGVDVVFAIDVSKSMLAEDVIPNRIERARQLVSSVIDQMSTDRVGIVVYAGKAYPQLPITTDYGAARMFLQSVNTDIVPSQGTAIAEAIDLSVQYFDDELETNRILFIISDGENHEEGLESAYQRAKDENVIIHTIGLGTSAGGPIPEKRNGRVVGYKSDRSGNTVVTRLDENTLRKIADQNNGEYFLVRDTRNTVAHIRDKIDEVEKSEIEARVFSEYRDQFQWFLAAAMLFFMIYMIFPERKMINR